MYTSVIQFKMLRIYLPLQLHIILYVFINILYNNSFTKEQVVLSLQSIIKRG
jgi:hypothetical protein